MVQHAKHPVTNIRAGGALDLELKTSQPTPGSRSCRSHTSCWSESTPVICERHPHLHNVTAQCIACNSVMSTELSLYGPSCGSPARAVTYNPQHVVLRPNNYWRASNKNVEEGQICCVLMGRQSPRVCGSVQTGCWALGFGLIFSTRF